MSQPVENAVPGWGEPAAERAPSVPWANRRDVVVALVIIAVLVVAGALLGLLWQAISPRSIGYVYQPHAVIPDENEALIGSDARFALLTAGVGALAALAAWTRVGWRGPATVAALVVGGLLGAGATNLVGSWVGGGHDDGAVRTLLMLPVRVRAHGVLVLEALAAVVVYALFAMFTSRDDLGRVDDEPAAESSAYDPAARGGVSSSWARSEAPEEQSGRSWSAGAE